jgi:hypothetical protein
MVATHDCLVKILRPFAFSPVDTVHLLMKGRTRKDVLVFDDM